MLHLAVENASIDIDKSLLSKNNIDINIKEVSNEDDVKIEKTALIIAFEKKIYKITYEIDEDDYVLNKKEMTALFLAVMQKNPKIVKLLLSRDDIDVNSKYKKITYETDEKGEFSIEKKHCEKTALYKAIKEKDIEIVKLLLSKSDIDVNCFAHFINEDPDYFRDETIEYNKTPLYIAVSVECPEIIELFH